MGLDMRVDVCEEFISIDGEFNGFLGQGQWSYFVRFSGCNLRCSYCDTKYSWGGGRTWAVSEVATRIKESGLKKITLTGGEPLLQEGTKDLMNVFDQENLVNKANFCITLETNGTKSLNFLRSFQSNFVRVVMDWKFSLPSDFEHVRNENLKLLTPGDWVKFIIGSREDYDQVKKLLCSEEFEYLLVAFSPCKPLISEVELFSWMKRDSLWSVCLNVQLHKLIGGIK